ncbi:MAG: hypothetical protein EBY66_05780 [Candidatus Fonsibacter lacus]|nr:hypothetical protein [Candidatus Fonsibacter lacus]
MEQVPLIALALVCLQVQPCHLLERRGALQRGGAVAVGHSEGNVLHRRGALADQLPVARAGGLQAVDAEPAGLQHPHLLHHLLAPLAVGHRQGLAQAQHRELLRAGHHVRPPAQNVPWGIGQPVRATEVRDGAVVALIAPGEVHQHADVPVADAEPRQVLQEHIQPAAGQVHVIELLHHRVGHVVEPDRLAGEHAGQHLLQPQVVRRADTAAKAGVVGLRAFSRLLRQIAAAAGLHAQGAQAQLFDQPPARFLGGPADAGFVNLQVAEVGATT